MRIYITDTDEIKTVALRVWDNKTNDGWSPDCFDELEVNFPHDHPCHVDDGYSPIANAACTLEEYKELIDWWESEITDYNNRTEHNWFVENLLSDEIEAEYAKDQELRLFED